MRNTNHRTEPIISREALTGSIYQISREREAATPPARPATQQPEPWRFPTVGMVVAIFLIAVAVFVYGLMEAIKP